MQEQLDWHYNGSNSYIEKQKRQLSVERQIRKQKTNDRLAKLLAFKQREGIDWSLYNVLSCFAPYLVEEHFSVVVE